MTESYLKYVKFLTKTQVNVNKMKITKLLVSYAFKNFHIRVAMKRICSSLNFSLENDEYSMQLCERLSFTTLTNKCCL